MTGFAPGQRPAVTKSKLAIGSTRTGTPWTKPALRLGHSEALTGPDTHVQAPFLARDAFLAGAGAGAGAASVDVAASAPF